MMKCERFQPNDSSCAQPLHSIEECKGKKTDEESHVMTKKEENGPEIYSLSLYKLKY